MKLNRWILLPLLLVFSLPLGAEWHHGPRSHSGFSVTFSYHSQPRRGYDRYPERYYGGYYAPSPYRADYYDSCSPRHHGKHKKFKRGCEYCERDGRYPYRTSRGRIIYAPYH